MKRWQSLRKAQPSRWRGPAWLRWRTLLALTVLALLAAACDGPASAQVRNQVRSQVRDVLAQAQTDTIGFGSCAFQENPQVIWRAVLANRPDWFLFLGDNIYGDTQDPAVLQAKYAQLAANPGFQQLRATTQLAATWDDHDYGMNDAGAELPSKAASKQVFLDFWGDPPGSERRLRDGGVYSSYMLGPPERRIQVILLDTRWDRSPLVKADAAEQRQRAWTNVGPYAPNPDPDARILGEEQWAWLEAQLRQPARLRLIGTSIPLLQEGTGWETWANFPHERQRLFDLLRDTEAKGVIILTGDTHRAQFSKLMPAASGVPYPLWEVNSSGLTENATLVAPDLHRLGPYYTDDNFGLVRVDWSWPDPQIVMQVRDAADELVLENMVRLSELQ